MFRDIDVKLEINQKLTILRSIKKFCFNANFINKEEFVKVFKVIVHGIGVKESLFRDLVRNKYTTVLDKEVKEGYHLGKRNVSIKVNKNFNIKVKT